MFLRNFGKKSFKDYAKNPEGTLEKFRVERRKNSWRISKGIPGKKMKEYQEEFLKELRNKFCINSESIPKKDSRGTLDDSVRELRRDY